MCRSIAIVAICACALWLSACSNTPCWHPDALGGISSVNHSYVNDYREAVSLYIEEPTDAAGERERWVKFGQFFATIEACDDVACVTTAVQTTTVVPGFKEYFGSSHERAQELELEGDVDRLELMLCGLKNGMDSHAETVLQEGGGE
jgi:hypothetical protein